MKWYKHDFDIARGNRTILIAKYDNSDYWFDYWAFTWTGAQLEIFREIGKLFNSKTVEVKPLYDNDGKLNESEETVITIITFTDSTGIDSLVNKSNHSSLSAVYQPNSVCI